MRINQPVTDVERQLGPDEVVVTRTDLAGTITYCNDDFCRISGFSREELLGQNHNIVRHPDMPPEAFADLWRCLGQRLPWTGIVKNRCKDGGYYWVAAHVAPVHEAGRIVGYVSTRVRPVPAQVTAAASAYAELRSGRKRHLIRDGQVYANTLWNRGVRLPLRRLGLRSRLLGSTLIFAIAFAVFAATGYRVLDTIKVGGPIYANLIDNKDLVADILPPPEYLIESWLTTLEMERASGKELEQLLSRAGKLAAEFDERRTYWDRKLSDPELRRALLDGAYPAGREFLRLRDENWIPAVRSGDRAALDALRPRLEQLYAAHRAKIDQLVQLADRQTKAIEARAQQRLEAAYVTLAAALVAGFALASMISVTLARRISAALGGEPAYVLEIARHVGAGNLGIHVERRSDDGSSILATMAAMQSRLHRMIGGIQQSACHVSESAAHTASSSRQLHEEANRQSEMTSNIAASAEQLSVSIAQVTDHAANARASAERSKTLAVEGGEVIGNALSAMHTIAEVTREASGNLSRLAEQSNRINGVVAVIKEIADQTNLLALNAAIEAARAGESGRGFAVVADEVRKLAERTAKSTIEISQIIGEVRNGLDSSSRHMEDGVSRIGDGLDQAERAGAAIAGIRSGSDDVVGMIASISDAMHEQSAASQDIARLVEQVARSTESTVAVAAESEQAVERLHTAADALSASAGRFSS